MKKEIMELWTKALRSGEFVQGQHALYRDNKYCVMDVLCMLAMLEGVCDYEDIGLRGEFDGNSTVAPSSVLDWAGMKSAFIKGEFVSLTGYNDHGWDFEQLADLIEENYEQL